MRTENSAVAATARDAVGLRTALKIMELWGATQDEMTRILRISRSTLARAKSDSSSGRVQLDSDQLERISLVLNIHAALRLIFENPANLYGFVSKPNSNPFFNGRRPLDVMSEGSFINLYETARRIDSLRGGLW